jgi:hypothetical protein
MEAHPASAKMTKSAAIRLGKSIGLDIVADRGVRISLLLLASITGR